MQKTIPYYMFGGMLKGWNGYFFYETVPFSIILLASCKQRCHTLFLAMLRPL